MNPSDIERFVAAAAVAQGLELDPEQLHRVARVFARNVEIAGLILDFDLPATVEAAPIFTP